MEDHFPHFNHPKTVHQYLEATLNLGLWQSEIILFEKYISKSSRILDLGCGAGRVTFGLHKLGYQNLLGVDISQAMVLQAQTLLQAYKNPTGLAFETHSATALPYPNESFDSIIFSFNGLMQIPTQEARQEALMEIHRVLEKDGVFIFTSHDRALSLYQDYWEEEKIRWANGTQDPLLMEFGNRICDTSSGRYFIHIPTQDEMELELIKAHFKIIFTKMRSEIANESAAVEDFSDDCRFWVVKKSATSL